MHRSVARLLALLTFVLAPLLAHSGAAAAPLSPEQVQKVREVIVAQMAAFAIDDADRAFEAATPAVREAIGSSQRFMAMVRGSYPMVYRPGSVNFHKPDLAAGTVLQLVEIKDDDEKSWLALFTLEQQPDQSWRISGCAVAENRWQSI